MVASTVADTAWTLMRGQLAFLQKHGFEVELVTSPSPLLERVAKREAVAVTAVAMERELSPRKDARTLVVLVRLLRRRRPDILYFGTPKAGLLFGLAGFIARIDRRIYLLRGLRLETERGLRRTILWLAEWVALHTAHEVVVVSPSLLRRARELRLLGAARGTVLGAGASSGVDVKRFADSPATRRAAEDLRLGLGIPLSAFVFGFVGRLVVDKGVRELINAFREVQRELDDVWLLIVGSEELGGLSDEIRGAFAANSHVRFTGWLDDTTAAHHAIDCLVLPTYREGFPNVPLEAGAAGRPVITTTATGAIDSILPGETGILVAPRSAPSLALSMIQMAANRARAAEMGSRGRDFVQREYAHEVVWSNLLNFLHGAGR